MIPFIHGTKAGILILVISFATLIFTEYTVEKIFNDTAYYQTHGWPVLVACGLAGVLIHLLNMRLNGADYRDNKAERKHLLFFIDIKYWPFVLPAIGVVIGLIIEFHVKL